MAKKMLNKLNACSRVYEISRIVGRMNEIFNILHENNVS